MNVLDPRLQMPWLKSCQQAILRAHVAGRIGGGWLIRGGPGVGGAWLARWGAARLFCERSAAGAAPCLECGACARTFEDRQPDLHIVTLEKRARDERLSAEIRIDQLRALSEELSMTMHGSRARVAIVVPAERMNVSAANAFLKTLEEPRAKTVLILVAGRVDRLPATVRSRCLALDVLRPTAAQSIDWLMGRGFERERAVAALALSGNAPLDAEQLEHANPAALLTEVSSALARLAKGDAAEDPAVLADAWSADAYPMRLAAIENWLTDRIRGAARMPADSPELRRATHRFGRDREFNTPDAFEMLDAVREERRLADAPMNKAIGLERILRGVALQPGAARLI